MNTSTAPPCPPAADRLEWVGSLLAKIERATAECDQENETALRWLNGLRDTMERQAAYMAAASAAGALVSMIALKCALEELMCIAGGGDKTDDAYTRMLNSIHSIVNWIEVEHDVKRTACAGDYYFGPAEDVGQRFRQHLFH